MNPSRRTHIQSYGYYQSKYNTQQQRKKRAMETSADFQNEHFLIGETQPSFSLTNVIHSIYVAQFQICSSTHTVRYTHTTIYNYCIAKFSLSLHSLKMRLIVRYGNSFFFQCFGWLSIAFAGCFVVNVIAVTVVTATAATRLLLLLQFFFSFYLSHMEMFDTDIVYAFALRAPNQSPHCFYFV